MQVDRYAEGVSFQVEGKDSYPSICGLIISLVIFVAVMVYAQDKFIKLVHYEETYHQSFTELSDINERLTYEQIELNLFFQFFTEDGEDAFTIIDNIDQYLKVEAQLISYDVNIDPFNNYVDQNMTFDKCDGEEILKTM